MLARFESLASLARDTAGWAVYRLQERILGASDSLDTRAKRRWISAKPDVGLTWGRHVTGDAFIAKVKTYASPDATSRVLEIGPGYGRLLQSWLNLSLPFQAYCAVDTSDSNLSLLAAKFPDPRVRFIHADAETVSLDGQFDIILSSLVFKHLYPSFERLLSNIARYARSRAFFIFDLREGNTRMFDPRDRVSYVRWYGKAEVPEILRAVGLSLVTFDTVLHDARHRRLLVVARKQP